MSGTVEALVAGMAALAGRLTPRAQREWAAAMRSELSYLPASARLRWAFGTLIAAIKLRSFPMQTGTFRINRWIMLVEVLGCFGPALLAWWEFTFGPSGVVRLNAEVIDKYFHEYAWGRVHSGTDDRLLGERPGCAHRPVPRPAVRDAGSRPEQSRPGHDLIAAPAMLSLVAVIIGLF